VSFRPPSGRGKEKGEGVGDSHSRGSKPLATLVRPAGRNDAHACSQDATSASFLRPGGARRVIPSPGGRAKRVIPSPGGRAKRVIPSPGGRAKRVIPSPGGRATVARRFNAWIRSALDVWPPGGRTRAYVDELCPPSGRGREKREGVGGSHSRGSKPLAMLVRPAGRKRRTRLFSNATGAPFLRRRARDASSLRQERGGLDPGDFEGVENLLVQNRRSFTHSETLRSTTSRPKWGEGSVLEHGG